MEAHALAAAIDRDPFRPVHLDMADGSCVEVPTPYLSFVDQAGRLYVARARRAAGPAGGDLHPAPIWPSEVAGVRHGGDPC
jgi:hypothetical protein